MPSDALTDSPSTALERLRWHEGLRRRWREARLEAGVQAAWACARVEGIALPVELFREHIATAGSSLPDDDSGRSARGYLRLMTYVDSLLPPLGGTGAKRLAPAPQLLAGLHRAACAELVSLNEVGHPVVSPAVLTSIIADVARATEDSKTALAAVARVHAAIVNEGVFSQGNLAVAWGLSRLLLVSAGIEPTGVAVPERTFATDPRHYRACVAGEPEQWVSYYTEALNSGAEDGRIIADMILAGRTGAKPLG